MGDLDFFPDVVVIAVLAVAGNQLLRYGVDFERQGSK